jgi:excisionase family DNA binding protein
VAQGIEKLLTVEDVMDTLRISRPTLYRMLKAGQLQPVRIGKRTLFDPVDIRGLIEEAKTGAKPRPAQERSAPGPKATKAASRKTRALRTRDVAQEQKAVRTRDAVEKAKALRTKDASEKPKAAEEDSPDDGDKQGRLL